MTRWPFSRRATWPWMPASRIASVWRHWPRCSRSAMLRTVTGRAVWRRFEGSTGNLESIGIRRSLFVFASKCCYLSMFINFTDCSNVFCLIISNSAIGHFKEYLLLLRYLKYFFSLEYVMWVRYISRLVADLQLYFGLIHLAYHYGHVHERLKNTILFNLTLLWTWTSSPEKRTTVKIPAWTLRRGCILRVPNAHPWAPRYPPATPWPMPAEKNQSAGT